ncbi:efflux RND transporter permease subunit [Algiphilus sp.]|uniref:efflux RND transporter permease subunit n=2 Tax=Algiphilus sp. TaxID=1872431 RepID=UPI0025BFB7EF|nr:efflux RND transporter permease subunit [Algiphilus sp.]MCK5770664.1 efflux RND transporter permease subunit [Algiphilus sp.]
MQFTDIFIRRPVLASVLSLVILLLGIRAGFDLTVREYPEIQNAQLSVTVPYPGADAELVAGFVTRPLEREIATADGIDFLSSSSQQGQATITAYLEIDKDPNEALTEISTKVDKLRNQLPEAAEDPIVQIAESGGTASMYVSFYSEVLNNTQIADYIIREVQPELASIPGLESAMLIGGQPYAMRVWLKPDELAAHDLTAAEVMAALRSQNVLSAVGETKGSYVRIGLASNTDLQSAAAFRELVVSARGDDIVRLADIAEVELGAERYDASARWDGESAIFIGIEVRPEANVLDVVDGVRERLPDIFDRMPEGMEGEIGFDSTIYIRDAIEEVLMTIIEAVVIVLVVIFLFLGSLRSALIPAVTVPLSLVGVMFVMLAMGYSLNLLTLLAMVLAIGMVVDDAIIVLENIHRHIEEGMAPNEAAIKGARELVGPVIAMTLTLVAVFAPIGFLSGITGTLFSEFAFTLAGAVLISGIIALTLTPMMCARILKRTHGEDGGGGGKGGDRLAAWLDDRFESWRQGYKRRLHGALDTRIVIAVFGAIVLVSCYFLFTTTQSELAPPEDYGFAILINEVDGYATIEYLDEATKQAERIAFAHEEIAHGFTLNGGDAAQGSNGFTGLIASSWTERGKTTKQIVDELSNQISQVPALRTAVVQPPPLPTPGQGYPVEFVLKSTQSPEIVSETSDEVIKRARETNKFFYVSSRQRVDQPETVVDVDREKAALLGIDMQQLSADLASFMAGGEVNRFALDGRSYRVVQQVQRTDRLNPSQLADFHIRAGNGELIPLSTVATLRDEVTPRLITRAQQLNADTIIAVPRPDISQGEALETLEGIAREVMPDGFQVDYSGTSRQYVQEGQAMLTTFAFALIIIYLVLAAQFESFRDPLIMLVTVPMSISGALLVLNIFGITNGMQITSLPATLNIYTQVGLVTLIGVISKHGILIVEFANKLQQQGLAKREAIEEAASIRLRPVLMTTAALVVAMFPLLIADGPGAAARFAIGIVIAAGMTIGTLFTLYVVPAMYLYIGRDYSAEAQPAAA